MILYWLIYKRDQSYKYFSCLILLSKFDFHFCGESMYLPIMFTSYYIIDLQRLQFSTISCRFRKFSTGNLFLEPRKGHWYDEILHSRLLNWTRKSSSHYQTSRTAARQSTSKSKDIHIVCKHIHVSCLQFSRIKQSAATVPTKYGQAMLT